MPPRRFWPPAPGRYSQDHGDKRSDPIDSTTGSLGWSAPRIPSSLTSQPTKQRDEDLEITGTTFENSLRVSHPARAIACIRPARTGFDQQTLENTYLRAQATYVQSPHMSVDEQGKQDGCPRFLGNPQQGKLFDVQSTTHPDDSAVPRPFTFTWPKSSQEPYVLPPTGFLFTMPPYETSSQIPALSNEHHDARHHNDVPAAIPNVFHPGVHL
jgi:hypothetical protein